MELIQKGSYAQVSFPDLFFLIVLQLFEDICSKDKEQHHKVH